LNKRTKRINDGYELGKESVEGLRTILGLLANELEEITRKGGKRYGELSITGFVSLIRNLKKLRTGLTDGEKNAIVHALEEQIIKEKERIRTQRNTVKEPDNPDNLEELKLLAEKIRNLKKLADPVPS